MKRILLAFGTRPEVIKLAPLAHELRCRRDAETILCSTGQHRQMLDAALAAFDLKADIDLDLMKDGQQPAEFFGRLMLAIQPKLAELNPDIVVVQGDTMTVTGAAFAGFLNGCQIAHVEAGLRTRDKRAPFPEEVNRRMAGVVADYHFPPTAASRDNLLNEGVPPDTIFTTGNTVVDALFWMRDRVKNQSLPPELDTNGRRLILVTAHRRESFGKPFRDLCQSLNDLAEMHDDIQLIYPVHLNPNVQKPVREILGDNPRIKLVEPVDYPTLVALLDKAELVLTDSGGIQEEAATLGKPTLILREKTERPEVVGAGVAKLVGTDREKIVREATTLLTDTNAYSAMAKPVQIIGDGQASKRIADVLLTGATELATFEPTR